MPQWAFSTPKYEESPALVLRIWFLATMTKWTVPHVRPSA
jgi:hypothetical protein